MKKLLLIFFLFLTGNVFAETKWMFLQSVIDSNGKPNGAFYAYDSATIQYNSSTKFVSSFKADVKWLDRNNVAIYYKGHFDCVEHSMSLTNSNGQLQTRVINGQTFYTWIFNPDAKLAWGFFEVYCTY
jgi:hypothetical protein